MLFKRMCQFRKLSVQDSDRSVRSLIFFVPFYLYLWLVVEMRLIYHGGGTIATFPVFLRDWAFFQKFLSYPGGPVEYLSAFLAQLFYYSWAGALVVTVQAWLICLCIDSILKAINSRRFYFVRFVPAILLLIIYGQYAYHFQTTIALLTALVFVCLYLKTTAKYAVHGSAVFLVLSAILYYIAGGAYLLFAMICGIYELLFGRSWPKALLYLLSAAVIPYIEGIVILGASLINAYSQLLPFHWKNFIGERSQRMLTVVYTLYMLVPVIYVLQGLWRLVFGNRVVPEKRAGKKQRSKSVKTEKQRLSNLFQNTKIRWVAKSLLLPVVAGAVAFLSFDSRLKATIEVDYYACNRMWDKVIETADRQPEGYLIAPAVNRALYHKGRLVYDMFRYPQYPDALLLTSDEFVTASWNQFGVYFDLGHTSVACRLLANAMEMYGHRPVLLKNLALINIAKGDAATARMYLKALSKNLFHADWADNCLKRLDSDPNLLAFPEISRLKNLMIKKDYALSKAYGGFDVLLDLLRENKQNRMAFEYLMTRSMLFGKLDRFASNFKRLNDFDYERIPPLYQEAILLYALNAKQPINLGGWQISAESRSRYNNFMQIYYGTNSQSRLQMLAKDYGDSYLFYYTYGFWAGIVNEKLQ